MERELNNIEEVAKEIRMESRFVRRKIKEGKIKAIYMGTKTFILREEVNRIKKEGVK